MKKSKIFYFVSLIFFCLGLCFAYLNERKLFGYGEQIREILEKNENFVKLRMAKKKALLEQNLEKQNREVKELTNQSQALRKKIAEIPVQMPQQKEKERQLNSELDLRKQDLAKMREVKSLLLSQKDFLALNQDLKKKEQMLQGEVDLLMQKKKKIEKEIEAISSLIKSQNRKISSSGLETEIYSISDEWGFVTLAAGQDKGVVNGSFLSVFRNGLPIARLKVISVQGEMSTAELAGEKEVKFQVGDKVKADSNG